MIHCTNIRGGLIAAALAAAAGMSALGQDNSFTYQGRLTASSAPAQGVYDFNFRLYNAATGGSQVGPTLCGENTNVVNGLFTTLLDFGTLPPGALYLEISVRGDSDGSLPCGNGGGYTTLPGRQAVTSVPHAREATEAGMAVTADVATDATQINSHFASYYTRAANLMGTVTNAGLSGAYGSAVTLNNAGNVLAGDGSGLRNVRVASTPTATNALALGSNSAAFFSDASNVSNGAYGTTALSGTYSQPVQFTNPGNGFVGRGGAITNLRASQVFNSIGWANMSGTYANQLTFNNAQNQFTGSFFGNASGITSLSAAGVNGRFSLAQLPVVPASRLEDRIFVASHAMITPTTNQWVNNSWVEMPASGQSVTVPFSGTAIMTWRVSGYAVRTSGFQVTPVWGRNYVLSDAGIPWFFNRAYVHEQSNGTVTFPIEAGAHWIRLAIVVKVVDGPFCTDLNDCVNWTLTVVR